MESYVEMEDRHERKERNTGESSSILLSAKMAELQKLKEKLMKAKDDAVQSWLDSKPLIDELEKLQSELASMKSQAIISSTTLSELESQVDNIGTSIRSKKQEELKTQTMINRINQALDNTTDEMEQIKIDRDEKHRTRLQLKQVLRLKKQSLQALQLTLRAIRLESEAYGASAAEAHRYITCSQRNDTLVKLMQQDYQELIRRAEEETLVAEWRIAVSMEQKYAAEKSRNSYTRRLQNLYSKGRTRRKTESNGNYKQTRAAEVEGRHSDEKEEDHAKSGRKGLQKSKARSFAQESQKKLQAQNKGLYAKNNNLSKKKKRSLFSRLRICLLQKIKPCLK